MKKKHEEGWKQEAEREERSRQVRDALTWTTRQRGTLDQVRTVLSPAGREFLDAAGGRIDREVRGDAAERHEAKLQLARGLADKEVREGPIDPAYVRQQVAAWEAQAQGKAREEEARRAKAAREAERPPAPLLPAWRDPTGQGRDSLGRKLDEPSIAAVVVRDGAVQREREALWHYLQGAYRDPTAAQAALGEVVKQRGWYQAREEIAGDPTQFGELRGKVGWFVSGASKEERARAERVVQAVPDSLRRVHGAEEAARQSYVRSVQAQQVREGTEVPGLSKAALAVLEGLREARLMAELPVKGEEYDIRKRRTEAAVAAVWQEGRADPRVAGELDGFMAAVGQRLGEEGERAALRAFSSGRTMELPGVGRKHQAGLGELAHSFAQGRDGVALSAAWGQRVEREAKEAERQRVRAEERQARGLPPEPEQDRERQRQSRGLGFGR